MLVSKKAIKSSLKMKKNTKLHIPIDTEGKETLKKRAEQHEMTLAQYCRYVLMNTILMKPKTKIPD